MRHFGIVVGQRDHQFVGGHGLVGQADGEMLADRQFNIVDELTQDVRHDHALAVGEHRMLVEEQIADNADELLAALCRLVVRQA